MAMIEIATPSDSRSLASFAGCSSLPPATVNREPLNREPVGKTLRDNVAELLARYEGLKASHHTVSRLRCALRIFLDYLMEQRVETAEALTIAHIHGFQNHLSARVTRAGLPLKPASINTTIKGVRVFLDLLQDYGYLTRRLAKQLAYVREPRLLPTSVLTHAQVRQLIRRIDTGTPVGIRDRTAIELLYSSGIRIGELETLALGDLDLDLAVARVVGKGRKERFVPIGKTALKWLTSYIRGVRPFMAQSVQTDRVFLNDAGAPMPQHLLRRRIREYADELALDIHITPHTFRRSCTSELIKSNANLYHVKQLLGHESFETLNHYAKLDIADLQKTHARCHPREKDDLGL
jgi:integrase/recombinase XerD